MCISVQTSLSPRPQIGLRVYYTPHHERGAVEKGINSLEQTLGIPILHVCSLAQSSLTLGDPMDCSPPGSSVHGISQARTLEWVITSFPILLTVNSGLVDNIETEKAGTPLQYSCLENPMDGGAWWAAVHGAVKSWTRLSDFTFPFTFIHWRRKWQPTPVFLPGEPWGRGNLVGCRLWGRTGSDMTEAT